MTSKNKLQSGLDAVRPTLKKRHKEWGRVGLVCNQASISGDGQAAWQVFAELYPQLTCFFGPQHGLDSTVQDNMVETGHSEHTFTGLPVYSLYSETREPTEEMLGNVDTIVFDLLVTGCRIYTYKYTLSACMRAALKFKKRLVVLDRMNPLGSEIKGPLLSSTRHSFIGEFPIPMQHGMTMGEIAQYFHQEIPCELEIIRLAGWNPKLTGYCQQLRWPLASPNLSHIDSVLSFVGTVLLEGTNLSEGRGTTLPFQMVGAPYVEDTPMWAQKVSELLPEPLRQTYYLQPTEFLPSFQKHKGEVCRGFRLHIIDRQKFPGFEFGLALIRSAMDMFPEFSWRKPGYEYNFEHLPIDLLLGIEDAPSFFRSSDFSVHPESWSAESKNFSTQHSKVYLYDRLA